MPSMKVTKIFGAVLAALIIVKVSDLVGGAMGRPHPLAKPAYLVAGAPAAPEASKPKAKKPAALPAIGPLLASASVERGKSVAHKCKVCHNLNKGGKIKVGPPLWGVVGAKKARQSFPYSDALKSLGGVWDYAALNHFLVNPRGFAPGTKMTFSGIKNDSDRAAVILYLRSLSDNPPPLP